MTHYDRGMIMREAGRLMRESGMDRSAAMKMAWANAKAPRQQQQAGFRAALKRYGIDADRIAERARETVLAITAYTQRPLALPPPPTKAIDLKRGADGVYRVTC